MHFAFTEDQLLFKEGLREFLAGECTAADVRVAWENEAGRVPGLWNKLAELGVVGLTAPESAGGMGLGEIDLVGLMEEMGRSAVPEPIIEHTSVAIPALAEAGKTEVLAAAAIGEATVTVVNPRAPYALHGADADWIIVEIDGELRLGASDSLPMEHQPALDGSRRLYRLDVPRGWGEPLDANPALAFDRGALATASQCVGLARHLIETTVAYVSYRHQFGKPVGTYQAVKHHLANAAMAVEFAAPVVAYASWACANNVPERSREVSMAKVLASDAVDLAAEHALQCHGAIGYTYEYDLQLWLKRAWALSAAWGDAGWHRDRVGRALGI